MLSHMGMMGVMGDAATALANAREAVERAARGPPDGKLPAGRRRSVYCRPGACGGRI